ncbi:pantoate--beta-alanine ligase [Aurantimonas sp. VKM B-3413]|uniref:pantoate--beta-alanine ligase n=1 Tax=Aurantimonas sp. VKM B-3413 TaxID=2779401 RepID=UPI001E5C297A|nr:pantoate--beta-alanine ligase [Aurantimonas sp. VKM B-3413]
MQLIETIAPLRAALYDYRRKGETIGVVPTMGYLHDGHLALVERAKAECDRVVVTVFVNPTQFGPSEDFAAYPRDRERDLAMLERLAVDVVFAPTVEEMYPRPGQTTVSVKPLGDILIGTVRPGHFSGVATVVSKLFHIVQPDRAYFGEKDYQQLAVIRRMVADLDMPLTIVGVPTVREPDGLAMSSRNVRLTPEARAAAKVLSRALGEGERLIGAGEADPQVVLETMRGMITAEPLAELRSLDLADAETLEAVERVEARPVVLLVTAAFGGVLLIDERVAHPIAELNETEPGGER